MKKYFALKAVFTLIAGVALVSCGGGGNDYSSTSRGTGWDVTGKNGGFELNTKYKEQETGPGLVFVEGGTFTMGRVKDDPMHDWNNTPNQQHVQSFYIDETEVTNGMYLEMLDWIKGVFPPEDEEYRNIYNGAVPDTLVWRNRLGFNEEMTKNYLRHPAYQNYPVVGVTWIQAVEFSEWRTDRVNELILNQEGYTAKDALANQEAGSTFSTETYLNAPTLAYGGDDEKTRGGKRSESLEKRKTQKAAKQGDGGGEASGLYVTRKDGIILPGYRLPTEAEWEYAALAEVSQREYNAYRGRKKYPWDGQYTRSGKRQTRGDHMANFKQGDGDYGGIAGWSDDGADITAEVMSYEPNDFGVYDMAGNVSEWVADVYRPIVDDEFNDFNYYRGNQYTKNKIGADGMIAVVEADSIVYDTLSNGKTIARALPGEIQQVEVDENETYLRTNFDRSDNRDFRDGDRRSSKYFDNTDQLADNKRMYDSPLHTVESDSLGTLDRQYDQENTRTTLIDNEVRVIKGGSWRDRAYWLDPASRRFYPQDMAKDDLGFRCAMSRVGSKSKKNKRPRN
ncbi:gliding motility lipoprotein GldJ [Nonlabens arenilitoris]|uniref:Gliding motility lipoprotein GldJ n=1 Tax=Nonlabens arenilitoris TaxID=1217969 RepID=A0A2S7UAH2_9FLAO|nr:gliding motility lipoprotein GldJ [Nonlabens arenilitoris]PQJ31916.1 gliding motility lipoprotein GldJ [Nonlabens arenilitoris]